MSPSDPTRSVWRSRVVNLPMSSSAVVFLVAGPFSAGLRGVQCCRFPHAVKKGSDTRRALDTHREDNSHRSTVRWVAEKTDQARPIWHHHGSLRNHRSQVISDPTVPEVAATAPGATDSPTPRCQTPVTQNRGFAAAGARVRYQSSESGVSRPRTQRTVSVRYR